ncbi:TIR domain-containing protein [Calditrichota bacterium]
MSLPIRTTLEDVNVVCRYLATKPTGATLAEAKAVVNSKHLDGRKLSAMRIWGLIIETEQNKLKLTELGRESVRNDGKDQAKAFLQVVRNIAPYNAIIERLIHRGEDAISATEVAVHWYEHFKTQVSDNDRILNDQAVCFFQLAEGAGLGNLVIGRKGSPTRLDFNRAVANNYSDLQGTFDDDTANMVDIETESISATSSDEDESGEHSSTDRPTNLGQGIFIGHGKNTDTLDQLKRILDKFKIKYRVAVQEPNLGRPIGEKVREIMQECNCAILLFTADEEFINKEGETIYRPSENVIHELGAASFLYGRRIVIMKEEPVTLPSNFRELGYITFTDGNLESKAMDVLGELIGFEIVKIST